MFQFEPLSVPVWNKLIHHVDFHHIGAALFVDGHAGKADKNIPFFYVPVCFKDFRDIGNGFVRGGLFVIIIGRVPHTRFIVSKMDLLPVNTKILVLGRCEEDSKAV